MSDSRSSDLVARLRDPANNWNSGARFEAADEIERLTREIRDGNAVFQGIVQANGTMGERNMRLSVENDRLRTALRNISNGRVGDQLIMNVSEYAKAQLK